VTTASGSSTVQFSVLAGNKNWNPDGTKTFVWRAEQQPYGVSSPYKSHHIGEKDKF